MVEVQQEKHLYLAYSKEREISIFNGLRDELFYLHLKESEFKFDNGHNDIYVILLKNLRQNNL